MEYEELLDRFQTLTNQPEVIEASLFKSESRLQRSMERTDTVQRKASSLAHNFEELEKNLSEMEKEIKNSSEQPVKADQMKTEFPGKLEN